MKARSLFALYHTHSVVCGPSSSHLGFDDEDDSQSFDDEEDSQSFDNDEDFRSCDKWKNFTLSNLTKADVDSSYFDFPMKALHTVQSLSMCIYTAQVQRYAIPTFHNLTHLHLDCLNYRWNFLIEVLKHCPKLQLLDLDEAGLNSDDQTWTKKDDKEYWVDPDIVPQCLSLHLRVCYLSSFLGLQGELRLARASSLCKLTFVDYPCDDSSESDSSSDANESSMGSNA
ncbi:hypothetical protein P8452_20462 [Trifolium repens]|nr:hypothetical protein P8452_20462 [Trifolium repens]